MTQKWRQRMVAGVLTFSGFAVAFALYMGPDYINAVLPPLADLAGRILDEAAGFGGAF